MIRVLIADDHPVVRDGLKILISMIPGMIVVKEVSNGNEVLQYLHNETIELLLLDMHMPEPNGVELIDRIRHHGFTVPILVLSIQHESFIVHQAIRAGANGYISKASEIDELLNAIKKTANGGKYIDEKIAEQLIFTPTDNPREAIHQSLSNRELEIFKLLTEGLSVNKIANRLFISNKTVSTHKANLMQKMKVNSEAELVKYAIQHHLFE